jgi:hypothetical protein
MDDQHTSRPPIGGTSGSGGEVAQTEWLSRRQAHLDHTSEPDRAAWDCGPTAGRLDLSAAVRPGGDGQRLGNVECPDQVRELASLAHGHRDSPDRVCAWGGAETSVKRSTSPLSEAWERPAGVGRRRLAGGL